MSFFSVVNGSGNVIQYHWYTVFCKNKIICPMKENVGRFWNYSRIWIYAFCFGRFTLPGDQAVGGETVMN